MSGGAKARAQRWSDLRRLGHRILSASSVMGVAAPWSVTAKAEPVPASPSEAAPSLGWVQCAGLDVAETERLLRVELAVVAARAEVARAPRVTVECKESSLHMEVSDAVSGGRRSLDLPAPAAGKPDLERTVALAASQLFLSSWLEMIVKERPEEKPPAPPERRSSPMRRAHASPRSVHDADRWELALAGALRFRNFGNGTRDIAPFVLARRRFSGQWLLGGEVGLEVGEAARPAGNIHVASVRAGILGGARFGHEPFLLDALVSSALVFVRASGVPLVSGAHGEERSALGADFALSLVPTLSFSHFQIGAVGQAGLLTPAFTARVPGGDPVTIHGPWVGIGLLLGADFGG